MKQLERHILGWLAVLGERIKRRTLPPILTYHSLDETGSVVSVSYEEFDWQMKYLKDKGFQTILLRDYVRTLSGRQDAGDRLVVITFDDGFKNINDRAVPIMLEYGFVGTVFVPTAWVGRIPGWPMDPGLPKHPLMNWSDLSSLLQNRFDIQSHTHTHCSLTTLGASEIEREIADSRKAIETNLDHEVSLLAYPYGEYNQSVIDQVIKAGLIGAVTIEFGINSPGADPFRLKRLGSAHFTERSAFRACISGTYGPVLALKRRFKRPARG